MKCLSISLLFLVGNVLPRLAWAGGGTITTYCDGITVACPCANQGASGNGCANSLDGNPGAHLAATGSASVMADSVVLSASGMTAGGFVVFLQGSASMNVAFGDGLRCAGGTVIRLGVKANPAGAASYPTGLDSPVAVRGLLPASGGTRYYQVVYRDTNVSFCTPNFWNLTNGVRITWDP